MCVHVYVCVCLCVCNIRMWCVHVFVHVCAHLSSVCMCMTVCTCMIGICFMFYNTMYARLSLFDKLQPSSHMHNPLLNYSSVQTPVDDQHMKDLEIALKNNNALKHLTLRSPLLAIPRTVSAIVNGASNSSSLKVLVFDTLLSFQPAEDLVDKIHHLRVKKKMQIITSWS